MIYRIISGGQTGVDQAGLRAAKRCGLATGGWAPRGWLTEDGAAPWLAEEYGLVECPEPAGQRPSIVPLWQWNAECYKARTRRNAEAAAATLWFEFAGRDDRRGFYATRNAVPRDRLFVVTRNTAMDLTPEQFARNWGPSLHGVVNIAGNRESKAPGIGAWAEEYLAAVFRALGDEEQ